MASVTAQPQYTARIVSTRPTPRRVTFVSRTRARLTRLAWVVAIAVLTVLTGVTGTVGTATAGWVGCPFSNGEEAPDQYAAQPYRAGFEYLMPMMNPLPGAAVWSSAPGTASVKGTFPASAKVTAYEYYGMGGASFTRTTNACGPESLIGNMAANYVFDFTKAVVAVAVAVYQWSSDPELLSSFYDPLDKTVSALRDQLFLKYLTPVVFFGAIWMAWIGLVKKRTSETIQGAVWMIVAAGVALAFMAQPVWVAKTLNNAVSTVNSSVMESVARHASGAATTAANPCYLNEAEPNAGVRRASCALVDALVYTPWAAGQFGVAADEELTDPTSNPPVTVPGHAATRDLRLSHMEATTTNLKELYGDRQAVLTADKDRFTKIRDAAFAEDNRPYWGPTWTGQSSGAVFNIATASLFASGFAVVFVLIISFAYIVYTLLMLLLLMASPAFLLAGVHPGFGRRIALKWLSMLAGTAIKRVGLGLMLSLLVGTYQIVVASKIPWFQQVAMIGAIGVALLMARKPLLSAMEWKPPGPPPPPGGSAAVQGLKRVGTVGMAAAVGMATGGAAAAGGGLGAVMAGAMKGGASGAMRGTRSGSLLTAAQAGGRTGARMGRKTAKQHVVPGDLTPPPDETDPTAPTDSDGTGAVPATEPAGPAPAGTVTGDGEEGWGDWQGGRAGTGGQPGSQFAVPPRPRGDTDADNTPVKPYIPDEQAAAKAAAAALARVRAMSGRSSHGATPPPTPPPARWLEEAQRREPGLDAGEYRGRARDIQKEATSQQWQQYDRDGRADPECEYWLDQARRSIPAPRAWGAAHQSPPDSEEQRQAWDDAEEARFHAATGDRARIRYLAKVLQSEHQDRAWVHSGEGVR